MSSNLQRLAFANQQEGCGYAPFVASEQGDLVARRDLHRWYEQVADDGTMRAVSYRASVKISASIDWAVGFASIGQADLASRMNIGLRTLQEAIDELVEHGHIRRIVKRGRGVKNDYYLVFLVARDLKLPSTS